MGDYMETGEPDSRKYYKKVILEETKVVEEPPSITLMRHRQAIRDLIKKNEAWTDSKVNHATKAGIIEGLRKAKDLLVARNMRVERILDTEIEKLQRNKDLEVKEEVEEDLDELHEFGDN